MWSVSGDRELFLKTKRKIVIAAHTCPFIDGIAIHSALSELNTDHKIYTRWLFFLIPSWCENISSKGFVSRQTEILNTLPEFCRVIFPSGGTIRWKSGFYHLAKQTGSIIFLFGLDHKTKTVVIDYTFDPNCNTFENIKNTCVLRLQKYKPSVVHKYIIGYGDECYNKDEFLCIP